MTLPVRDFECPAYDGCLIHAAERNWPSFTCLGCPRNGSEQTAHMPLDLVELGEVMLPPVDHQVVARATWSPPELHDDIDHQCCDCGRRGDARSVFLVGGLPRCILCRPDLGAPVLQLWQLRAPEAQELGPLLSVSQLADLARRTSAAVRRRLTAHGAALFVFGNAGVLVPARTVGLTPGWHPKLGAEIAKDDVARLLCQRSTRGALVSGLVRGRRSVPWLELAHLLFDNLQPKGSTP